MKSFRKKTAPRHLFASSRLANERRCGLGVWASARCAERISTGLDVPKFPRGRGLCARKLAARARARACRCRRRALLSAWLCVGGWGRRARVAAALARAEVPVIEARVSGRAHAHHKKSRARAKGGAVALQKWAVFCRASCCEDGADRRQVDKCHHPRTIGRVKLVRSTTGSAKSRAPSPH